MSEKVDTRVVRMEFDNAQFEKKVKQTTKSLDNLNKSMDFHDAGRGLDDIKVKISAMEVAAIAAISNITTKIVGLGIQLVKSLSVDNIAAGWAKYGDKTTSVATMIAQKIRIAGKEIEDQAEKLKIVNEQLDLLAWFSDETSYSFNDMVSNVGKFTAAGQDLDTSVKAMEGIATWAALSGQNAQTASMAMYQLAQAMSAGSVKLQDWKSIQNANMDTEEFRETILETAVSLGQLTKEGDEYITKTGKRFKKAQFTTLLSEGWFSSDVLLQGLNKYSSAVDEIYRIAEETGKTASEVIEEYGDQLDEFGIKAFKAAQEARTLQDVLNSVQDAVSSKWMQTFENIFGGQEESVKLWTELSNQLYSVFAESGNFRNNVLSLWGELGGRNDIFGKHGDKNQGAFWNLYDAVIAVVNTIKKAWNTIFPLSQMEDENSQAAEISRSLKNITKNIQQFTLRIKNNTKVLDTISRVFKIVFSTLKFGLNTLRLIRYALDPVIELVKQLTFRIFDEILYFLEKFNTNGNRMQNFFTKIHDVLEDLISTIKLDKILEVLFGIIEWGIGLLSKLPSLLEKIAPVVKTIGSAIYSMIKWLLKVPSILNELSKKWTGRGIIDNIKYVFDSIIKIFKSFFKKEETVALQAHKKMQKNAAKFGGTDKENIPENTSDYSYIWNDMLGWIGVKTNLKKFKELFSGFKVFGEGMWSFIKGLTSIFAGLSAGIGKILNTIGNVFLTIGNVMTKMFTGQKLESFNERLWGIIVVLGISAVILGILSNTLKNIVWAVTGFLSPLTNLSDAIATIADSKLFNAYANLINSIVRALLVVAVAMAILAGIKYDGLWKPLIVLAVVLAAIGVLMFILLKYTKVAVKGTQKWLKYTAKFANIFKEGVQKTFKAIEVSIKKQQELNKIYALTTFIMILTNALLKVSIAMLIIQTISWEGVWKTILLITVLVSSIILVSTLCKKGSIDVRKAQPGLFAMIGIAMVLKQLGKTILETQDVDWKKAWPIMVAVTILLSYILAMMFVINQNGKKQNAASTFTIIGTLIGLVGILMAFTRTVTVLAGIDMGNVGVAVVSIFAFMMSFVLLLAMTSSMKKSEVDRAKNAFKAMALISGSLLVFAISMKILSTLNWKQFGIAILSITIFVTLFAGLMATMAAMSRVSGQANFSQMIIETAIAFGVLTAALLPFAAAMLIMGSLSWEKIAKGFVAMAGSMLVLGIGAALLKSLTPIIVAFAASVLSMGIGIFLAGKGLQALADGILALSRVAKESMGNFIEAFSQYGAEFMQQLGGMFGNFMTGLFNSVADMGPALVNMIESMLNSLLELLFTMLPRVVTALVENLAHLLDELAQAAESIADSTWQIILAVIKTLDDHGDEIFDHVWGILADILQQLGVHAKEISAAIGEIVVGMLEGLVEWLGPNVNRVVNVILDLIGIILKAVCMNIIRVAALAAKVMLTLFAFGLSIAITLLGSLAALVVQFVGGLLLMIISTLHGFTKVIAQAMITLFVAVVDATIYLISNSGTLLMRSLMSLFLALGAMMLDVLADIFSFIPMLSAFFASGRDYLNQIAKDSLDVDGEMDKLQEAIAEASSNILGTVSMTVNGIGDTLGAALTIIDGVTDAASGILGDAFSDFQEGASDTGAGFIEGLFNAIDQGSDKVADATGDVIDDAVDRAKDEAEINSPSKVFMRIGEYMIQGLVIGIQNGKQDVYDGLSEAIRSTIGMAENIISETDGDDITLVVDLDTSKVESQAARVQDIMTGISNPTLSLYGQNADYTAKATKRKSSDDAINSDAKVDKSKTVTYNNTFNISSTDPQESAEEIDKKLKEQSMRAKYARGDI